MGPFGLWELLILLLVILLLSNARRMRGWAQAIRQSRREFRRGARADTEDQEAKAAPRTPHELPENSLTNTQEGETWRS